MKYNERRIDRIQEILAFLNITQGKASRPVLTDFFSVMLEIFSTLSSIVTISHKQLLIT